MINNFPNCRDKNGLNDCFGVRDGAGKRYCICLSDTSKTPCPFYKTIEQIVTEDPEYYTNLRNYSNKYNKYKSFRKEAK